MELGLGCNAHISSNSVSTAAGELPVKVEAILVQIYLYFRNFTVRTTELRNFCAEASIDFQKLLGYLKKRWLAMIPAIERILKLFDPFDRIF